MNSTCKTIIWTVLSVYLSPQHSLSFRLSVLSSTWVSLPAVHSWWWFLFQRPFNYLMQEAGDNARPKSQRHITAGLLSSMEKLPVLHMRTVPSVYSELFKGLVWRCFALSVPLLSSFLLSEVYSVHVCVPEGWELLSWMTSPTVTYHIITRHMKLDQGHLQKHYKSNQLGSWILISWCHAHSVVLVKRHCLQCASLFSPLTIFSRCFFVQWSKPLKYPTFSYVPWCFVRIMGEGSIKL